jgi:hypothetical protein
MANKKLLYNENGTNAEIANSGSLPAVYFDDATNTLVAQGLVINRVTASIGSTNGILGTDATGKLTVIPTGSNGQYLQSDGISWAFRNATGVATGDYLPGSDLSGALAAPTVTSIQNVSSGTLSASYGGTGVSSFTSGGLLVKDSTNTLKFVRPDAGASVLRPDGSGSWYSGGATGTGAYNVSATYFTCSAPGVTISNLQWVKPTGHKNIKVILMGGGGGGGGGVLNPTSSPSPGYGFGGGAAGFSVYDFIESGNLTASITIGAGGIGGVAYNPTLRATGSNGDNTIFSSSNIYYFVAGGGGATATAAGIQSFGNVPQSSGNGGRGQGGGGLGNAGSPGGSLRLINYSVAAGGIGGATQNAPGGVGGSTITAFGAKEYFAFLGGGGGGGASIAGIGQRGGNGGNGVYGSGGGGSANTGNSTSPITRGGNGGDGYAIIISW